MKKTPTHREVNVMFETGGGGDEEGMGGGGVQMTLSPQLKAQNIFLSPPLGESRNPGRSSTNLHPPYHKYLRPPIINVGIHL